MLNQYPLTLDTIIQIFNIEDQPELQDLEALNKFLITSSFNFPITNYFSIEPGVNFIQKGTKAIATESNLFLTVTSEGTIKYYSLDVPINAKLNLEKGDFNVFAFGGPYIGMGLSGKSVIKTSINGVSGNDFEDDLNWGEGDANDLKRLDYGVNAGIGFGYKNIELNAFYGFGLTNMAPTDFTLNSRNLYVTLGYRLNLSKE